MGDKSPLPRMILLGIVRHLLSMAGTALVAHGMMTPDVHERLVGSGAEELAGAIISAVPFVWSALQKSQMKQWLITALKLNPATPLAQIPTAASGPNVPI